MRFPSARDLCVSLLFSASRVQFGYLSFWDRTRPQQHAFRHARYLTDRRRFLTTFDTVAALRLRFTLESARTPHDSIKTLYIRYPARVPIEFSRRSTNFTLSS